MENLAGKSWKVHFHRGFFDPFLGSLQTPIVAIEILTRRSARRTLRHGFRELDMPAYGTNVNAHRDSPSAMMLYMMNTLLVSKDDATISTWRSLGQTVLNEDLLFESDILWGRAAGPFLTIENRDSYF
jgi:hypothetical protein